MGGNLYPSFGANWKRTDAASSVPRILVQPALESFVTVPRNTVMRHTPNAVLKNAGLPKAF